MKKEIQTALTAVAAMVFTAILHAGAWAQLTEIKIENPESGAAAVEDSFGSAVSISGNTAAIGAYMDSEAGEYAGAVFIFTRSSGAWVLQQKLIAPDAAANDFFGASVVISGDTVVIGSIYDDDRGSESGSVYIFTRSGGAWVFLQKLLAPDGEANEHFGSSVAISGDTAVVGVPDDDDFGGGSGSAYVFTCSGGVWTQQQKITATGAAAKDHFGYSVTIDGDTIIAGAPQEWPGDGLAFAFTRSGGVWTQQQKIEGASTWVEEEFGHSVSLSGDTVIIGTHYPAIGHNRWFGYVFTRSAGVWTEGQTLSASDSQYQNHFSASISLSGDTAILGAYGTDGAGENSGAAYLFTCSGGVWSERQKLTASDAAEYDEFGYRVATDGKSLLVGVLRNSSPESGSGAAYLYSLDATPPSSSLTALSDTTIATPTLNLSYTATDDGDGAATTTLWVKTPGASAFAGSGVSDTGTTGTLHYTFTGGDGVYEFATKALDYAGNAEDDPATAVLTVLVNTVENSDFTTTLTASDAVTTFPMTNGLDMIIAVSGATPGGTITVSRTVGDTAPAGYDPAKFIDEYLTITSAGLGTGWTATLTWNFDPANDDSLGAALNTLYQFDGPGNYTHRLTITPIGSTITVSGLNSFSDWYAGELVAPSEVGDWTLLK